jgi:hypothetical protein
LFEQLISGMGVFVVKGNATAQARQRSEIEQFRFAKVA